MDLEQRLHASYVAPDPGAEFTAAVMARVVHRRSRRRRGVAAYDRSGGRNRWLSRFVILGVAAVAGTAMAMLAERLARVPERSVVAAVSAPAPVAAVTNSVAAAGASVEVQPAETDADATRPVRVPMPAPSRSPSGSSAPADASLQYVVLLMPLRQEGGDAAARALVESFHAAAIQELQNVPGLTLQVQSDTSSAPEQRADFVVTMTGVATPQAGVATVQTQTTSAFGGRFNPMAMVTRSDLAEGRPGSSPAESAAHLVKTLRERVFARQ